MLNKMVNLRNKSLKYKDERGNGNGEGEFNDVNIIFPILGLL